MQYILTSLTHKNLKMRLEEHRKDIENKTQKTTLSQMVIVCKAEVNWKEIKLLNMEESKKGKIVKNITIYNRKLEKL